MHQGLDLSFPNRILAGLIEKRQDRAAIIGEENRGAVLAGQCCTPEGT